MHHILPIIVPITLSIQLKACNLILLRLTSHIFSTSIKHSNKCRPICLNLFLQISIHGFNNITMDNMIVILILISANTMSISFLLSHHHKEKFISITCVCFSFLQFYKAPWPFQSTTNRNLKHLTTFLKTSMMIIGLLRVCFTVI